MSGAFAVGELDHLPPAKRRRLLDLFDVEQWPDPLEDGLEHSPGEARPIEGPLPIALEDVDEVSR